MVESLCNLNSCRKIEVKVVLLVQEKTSIYFPVELSLRTNLSYFVRPCVDVRALITRKSYTVRMRNAILRWPKTVFAYALVDAILRAHNNCNKKHGVDTTIILFAQCHTICVIFLHNSKKCIGSFMLERCWWKEHSNSRSFVSDRKNQPAE